MIYVLSKDGKPLMPCSKQSRVRRWPKKILKKNEGLAFI